MKHTASRELVHWEPGHVDFAIDDSVASAVPGASDAVVDAMRGWSGEVGAPILQPRLGGAPEKPGFDGRNGVFFAKGGYAPAGTALAITVLTYDNVSGRILDADVVFNGAYAFSVLPDPDRAGAGATHTVSTDGVGHDTTHETSADQQPAAKTGKVYDLYHVMAHETGHTLGLNDETAKREALMYRYSSPNDASMRAPASDDLTGLSQLYGSSVSAGGGCGGATIAPHKPSSVASSFAFALGVGLIAWLLLRSAHAQSRLRSRVFVPALVSTAVFAVACLPSIASESTTARAAELQKGHARAKITGVKTTIEDGIMRTDLTLETESCRAAACPTTGFGSTWGGTMGNVRQEVGGYYAPEVGEHVDVSFAKLPSALAPIRSALAGLNSRHNVVTASEAVRVITAAAD